MILWRMIRWFFYYLLHDYDSSMDFMEMYPKLKEEAIKSGEYADWFSSRWRYAWKMTRVQWKHLDCLKHC
ncbi:MAG: hypothetical protein II086_10010 [Ruminococcus sp.]|nr:hypothetical protein [Ruminococcus sp.]